MRAVASAKINLSLRVGSPSADGYHPLRGLFQSVTFSDRLRLDVAEEDGITGWDGGDVPDGPDNLAWRAVTAVRGALPSPPGTPTTRLAMRLDKRIPVAAGLGGGSADAAAALHLAVRVLGGDRSLPARLAPGLGSDVPFCVVGGTALVADRGTRVTPQPPLTGFALGCVVPPVELSTPAVYAEWDRLGEPGGPAVPPSAVPPTMRPYGPLVNDLYPAAVSLEPGVDDWRHHLAAGWGRPVAMSGSGPTLFAWFADTAEAEAALTEVPPGVRAAHAVEPSPHGWRIIDG